MKRIIHYLRPYAGRMTIGFVIKFTGTIAELILPWILTYMIDNVIPQRQVAAIYLWGGVMFLCAVMAVIFNITANRMAALVSRNATEAIRNDLFASIMQLSNRQMDAFTLPSLISRTTTDTYNIHQMLGMMQRMAVRAPILLLGGLAITLTLDPVLTGVLVAVMPVIILMLYLVTKRGIPMFTVVQRRIDDFVRIVREDTSGIRVIKALSKEEYETDKFSQSNMAAAEQERKAGMVMGLLGPGMNFWLNIGTVLVILVSAYRVNNGVIKPGVIIAFCTYVTLILNALLFVSRIFVTYSKASASAKRIVEVLDCRDDLVTVPLTDKPQDEQECAVEFEHVCFSYLKKENNLSDISFRLRKGETLGIIGATGSGKSTIVQLLMRFYDTDSGVVRVRGRDVRSYEKEQLRALFGVAFQNDFISQDTIGENIRFGREITEEQIQWAAECAQAMPFIREKQQSFDTMVAVKGADLSGGQKQRLLVSRALAGNPEILILDDSMSALDYRTDARLRRELKEHFAGTTAIIIAQRISSIMNSDHIMVLDEGRMAGYGTHEELLACCDIYREIYEIQMGDREADEEGGAVL